MMLQRRVRLARVAFLGITLGGLCGGVPPAVSAQSRADFETSPTLAARDLVPAERLQGPGYRIDDAVPIRRPTCSSVWSRKPE